MITVFYRILASICTFGMFLFGFCIPDNFKSINPAEWDTVSNYKSKVKSVNYENDFDSAVPQTQIRKIVEVFYASPLPEGKTEKKVMVIGYDGCRADTLSLMKDNQVSAIRTLQQAGGDLVLSYCGGKNYPVFNTQATSTAPGWCSMVTGEWADVHGVTDNSIPMKLTKHTLFSDLITSKAVDSTAFYVSWGGHFSGEDSTYITELKYIQNNQLNATFLRADNDAGTLSNTLADINKANCSDFIFSILEFCDHDGHDTGFNPANPAQVTAFAGAEDAGTQIINAVKSRATYNTEDWLIIITSDHGGYNLAHGYMTMMERYTFIATNQPVFTK